MIFNELVARLSRVKFHSFTNEKRLQGEISHFFKSIDISFRAEVILSSYDRIDFLVGTTGIEVKIGGRAIDTLNQVSRYANHECIDNLILLTNKAHGFPNQINGKEVRTIHLAAAWL